MSTISIYFAFILIIVIASILAPYLEKIEAKRKKSIKQKIDKQKIVFLEFLDTQLTNKSIQADAKGYPLDWQLRRQSVLIRDNFKCQKCSEEFIVYFDNTNDWYRVFFDDKNKPISQPKSGFLAKGYHVHHKTKLSKGGNNTLSNLQLLCEKCHTEQEGHRALKININLKRHYRKYRKNNKLKTARIEHTCDICTKTITQGETYFGGQYKQKNSGRFGIKVKSEICHKCYKKYEKRN